MEEPVIGMAINMAVKPCRDMLLKIEQVIRARGLMLNYFLGSASTKVDHLVEFASGGINALIASGFTGELMARFSSAMPGHPPLVMQTYAPLPRSQVVQLGNFAEVTLDNAHIGRRAADFFLGRGLKNFAFIGRNGDFDARSGGVRCGAYEARIAEVFGATGTFRRLMVGTYRQNDDWWETNDRGRILEWARSLPEPCGVLVNGDHVAFKLAKVCQSAGIPVPRRIEILCVDNVDGFCEAAMPAVSFVCPDFAAWAEKTVSIAVALGSGADLPKSDRFSVVSSEFIVERGSTDLKRGYGQIAVRAQEFIRSHFMDGIGVMDVAKALKVSRRTLEVRVREATGSSVLEIIRERRMETICRLLATTDYPITDVVMRSGYPPTKNPGSIFKRRYGMSMREYREKHAGAAEP